MGNSQGHEAQPTTDIQDNQDVVEDVDEDNDENSEYNDYLNEWPTEPTEFPDLFRECTACTYAAISIFILADLRRLAREGHIQPNQEDGTGDVLSFPIRFTTDIAPIWDDNVELLKHKMKRIEYDTFDCLAKLYYENSQLHYETDGGQCYSMGDERASEECVYGILVNSVRKTITLVFRGSITLQDWVQDSKTPFRSIDNPLHKFKREIEEKQNNNIDISDLPAKLPLHSGFLQYLYNDDEENPIISSLGHSVEVAREKFLSRKRSTQSGEQEGAQVEAKEKPDVNKNMSKIDYVMKEIEEIYKTRPDYKLYITGHSLGGALSLIAALEAAVRFTVLQNKPPVTCITLGNPKAGGAELRKAIYTLETMHHLRVLCIHNANDLVPMLPNSCCFSNIYWKRYKHAGMQLRMLDEERMGKSTAPKFSVRYRGKTRQIKDWSSTNKERVRRISTIALCVHRIGERHFYGNYLRSLNARQEALSSLYLNDFYEKLSDDW